LIAQGVDAICVVPFSTEALEPVLKKAREAGIVVISHEAAGMENIDYDIEAFDNDAYGRHFMERIGELTGGEGEYVLEVGALTSASHNRWFVVQKHTGRKLPEHETIGDKIETKMIIVSYKKFMEDFNCHPKLPRSRLCEWLTSPVQRWQRRTCLA
jgi:simple sugar transport system substrate-binding protein